jgi:hypothetical protein
MGSLWQSHSELMFCSLKLWGCIDLFRNYSGTILQHFIQRQKKSTTTINHESKWTWSLLNLLWDFNKAIKLREICRLGRRLEGSELLDLPTITDIRPFPRYEIHHNTPIKSGLVVEVTSTTAFHWWIRHIHACSVVYVLCITMLWINLHLGGQSWGFVSQS